MNNRRKLIVALGAGALAAPFASYAQQQTKVWRVGFLGAETATGFADRVEALRAGLRDLGYVEGKNIVIEFRWAEGKYDRLDDLANELVRLKVDVVVTDGAKASLAAKRSVSKIPIVLATISDPIALGLVESLAHPGGNITGLAVFAPELMAKRLELLKEAKPGISRVGVFLNPENPSTGPTLQTMGNTARSLNVTLVSLEARSANDIENIFAEMPKRRINGLVVYPDTLFVVHAKTIASLAAKQKLPSIGFEELVEAGGIMSYAPPADEAFRRAAAYIHRILQGAKPGDLPIERPTTFELIVNVKASKALGIKIPNSILVRATKVIE